MHILATIATLVLLKTTPDVVQGTDYSCGPSALMAVFGYYGKPITEEDLLREMNVNKETGAKISEIVQASLNRGIKTRAAEGVKLAEVEAALERKQPVMLLIQAWRDKLPGPGGPDWLWLKTWKEEWDEGHYIVAIGKDRKNIYFEDPWVKGFRAYLSKAELAERWHGWTDDDKKAEGQAIFFESTPDAKLKEIDLNFVHVD